MHLVESRNVSIEFKKINTRVPAEFPCPLVPTFSSPQASKHVFSFSDASKKGKIGCTLLKK